MVDRVTGSSSDAVSRRRSALRRLGDLLAPSGPPAGVTDADLAEDVLLLAERHHLLPTLRSVLAAGRAELTSDRLKVAHVRNLARNLALVDQANELLAALDRAGIPAVPLKGIDAVVEDLYPDWGARTMADLDLLVEPSAEQAAAELLADLGYTPVGEELVGHHHLTPMTAPGKVGVVEVHVGLQEPEAPAVLDVGAVLGRAKRVPGRPGLRLDRTDAATHLVDHAQHVVTAHRLALDVRALHETALVVRRVPDVDWEVVRERFARAGCVQRLDAHLAASAELFGVRPPVAPAAVGRWVARRELFVDDHPLLGLLDQPHRRLARLSRERMEGYVGTPLSGAATWRARARYLREVGAHRRAMAAGAPPPRPGDRAGSATVGVTPPS